MKVPLIGRLAKAVRDLRNDWKNYQQLKNFSCTVCGEHITRVSYLEFKIRKRIRPKFDLILDFDPVTRKIKPFHLECKIATQIRDPSLRIDRVDKPTCEREISLEKDAFEELIKVAFEKAPYEIFGVLERDGDKITRVVKTYAPTRLYGMALDIGQRKKVTRALESGYDAIFHSHLFSPVLSEGDEIDFLSMGCQLMLIVGGTYKKLVYTNRRVRKFLSLGGDGLDPDEAYERFRAEYELSDISAYVLEGREVRRARIKVKS